MAITKIIAGKGSVSDAAKYILNEKKTDGRTFTATLNCDPEHEVQQMLDTKAKFPEKSGGCFHNGSTNRPGSTVQPRRYPSW